MAQIVEAQIGHAELGFQQPPGFGEGVGAALAVFSWLAKKHQVTVNRAYRVVQRCLECLCGPLAEWDGACAVILGISDERMPVSRAMRTIQPSMGLL